MKYSLRSLMVVATLAPAVLAAIVFMIWYVISHATFVEIRLEDL